MAKMNKRMIALCSAAVGSLYFTGFALTEPNVSLQSAAAKETGKGVTVQIHRQLKDTSSREIVNSVGKEKRKTNSRAVQSANNSSLQNKKYKDGTFVGEASNRIGSVQVSVTTKNDKIISVKIIDCTTSYPESNIASLPEEVIARQSENIDLVSGATLSSQDFQGAVQQALQKAHV